MMQRYKALETSVVDESWANAQWLELLPRTEVSVVSEEERNQAVKEESKEQKRVKTANENLQKKQQVSETGLSGPEPGTDPSKVRPGPWWQLRTKKAMKKVKAGGVVLTPAPG